MILILDIDGTLADDSHRHYLINKVKPTPDDWEAYFHPGLVVLDIPIPGTYNIISELTNYFDRIIFLTGREEELRSATTAWLEEYYQLTINATTLFMRPRYWTATEDMSIRAKFKATLFQKEILPRYPKQNFIFVDDNEAILKELAEFGTAIKAPECWTIFH